MAHDLAASAAGVTPEHVSQLLLAVATIYTGTTALVITYLGAMGNRHAGRFVARLPLFTLRAERLASEAAERTEKSLKALGATGTELPATDEVSAAVLRRIRARQGIGALWTSTLVFILPAGLWIQDSSMSAVVFLAYVAMAMTVLDATLDIRANSRDQITDLAVNALKQLALPGSYEGKTVAHESTAVRLSRAMRHLGRAIDRAAGAGIPLAERRLRRSAAAFADHTVNQLRFSTNELLDGRTNDRSILATQLASVIRRHSMLAVNVLDIRPIDANLIDESAVTAMATQPRSRDGLGWVWAGWLLFLAAITGAWFATAHLGLPAGAQAAVPAVITALGYYTLKRLGIPMLEFPQLPWSSQSADSDSDDASS